MLATNAMTAHDSLPVVGIPADVRTIDIHPFHAVGEKYINAVAHGAGALPLLLPAVGEGHDLAALDDRFAVEEWIARLDGLFLPGSPSNVEPQRYGGPPSAAGTLYDAQRDATALPLIEAAFDAGLPLLAVCRGIQELNVALGGTLHQRLWDVPGLIEHRADTALPRERMYDPAHRVALAADGEIARITGARELEVNSLHGQGLDAIADRLAVEATAPDGLVEAVRVKDARAFALGVQWHPEWQVRETPHHLALFAAFGDACRARAAARQQPAFHGRVA